MHWCRRAAPSIIAASLPQLVLLRTSLRKAEAVIAVLAARDMPLTRTERDRILREPALAPLERWLTRAATCKSAADLFARRSRGTARR
jgi:hypothetical protein